LGGISWAHGDENLSAVNSIEVDDVNSGLSLAESGIDMTGAMAIMNVGSLMDTISEYCPVNGLHDVPVGYN